MIRNLLCLIRLLLIGMTIAILISWSLAAWGAIRTAEVNRPPFDASFPPYGIAPPPEWKLRTWVPRRGPGLRHDIVTEMEWIGSTLGAMEGSRNRYMERAAAGWPVPCLQWATDDSTDPGVILRGLPVPVPHRDWPERRLGLRPLGVGLVVDVMVWTGVIGVVTTWVRFVRVNRRLRRGLCPWCGYPLGSSTLCPECGRSPRPVQESLS